MYALPAAILVLLLSNPWEVGVQITGVHLHKIDESPISAGGRVFFNFNRRTALDMEVIPYRRDTSALIGIKTGWRAKHVGMFGKARAGIWRMDKTFRAADLGAVFEYYPTPRTAIRIDLGDTILFYGAAPLGTVHNFQPGLGFSFRF